KGDATIILVVTVNAGGTVRDAVPDQPNKPFSSAAATVAKKWTFKPATRDGPAGVTPVAAKIRIAIDFHEPPPPPPPEPEAPKKPVPVKLPSKTGARASAVE